MRKKILYIVLLTMMVLTACGKTEDVEEKDDKKQVKIEEEKKTVEADVSSEKEILDDKDSQSTADAPVVQEPSNQTESNENQSNKNESTDNSNTTTGSSNNTTTKPSTGNSGSTNNSGSDNSGSSNNSSSNNTGTTTQPSTPVHEHKWIEVTEEKIHYYAWRTICNVCGTDLTDMTSDDRMLHVAMVCGGSYANYFKEVNFVTENIQKETIITGYKCECGAEK